MSQFGIQTTDDLIENVKRRAFLPEAQATLSDDDILKFLNEEMFDSLLPTILQYHQEYLVYQELVNLLPNTSVYKIPYRALGRRIRDVKYVDTNMNLYTMTRIMPEDRSFFQETGFNPYKAFYVQADEIVLQPGVGFFPVGFLMFLYYMRPNSLTTAARTCQVTAFDLDTGVITVDSIPANITSGSLIDIIEYLPGNKTKDYDIPVVAVDALANTITIAADQMPATLALQDYVNTAGESYVPQVPSELHSLLAERAAARCLASLGHLDNLNASNAKIAELEKKSGSLIDNRTEGSPIKLNNLGGILRQSKISRRRFYF